MKLARWPWEEILNSLAYLAEADVQVPPRRPAIPGVVHHAQAALIVGHLENCLAQPAARSWASP